MINPITGRSFYGEAMPSFHPDSVGLPMISCKKKGEERGEQVMLRNTFPWQYLKHQS